MTFSSADYWEDRYASGHGSGAGSRGAQAAFKAEFLNRFVADHDIRTVIEHGVGDGHQLALANYPYCLGTDVSPTAIEWCREAFDDDYTKAFLLAGPGLTIGGFDLALSLDVLYHLIEDDVYDAYLATVFGSSRRWVILYTSDLNHGASNDGMAAHMRHRTVTADIADGFPGWKMHGLPFKGMDSADFYIYERDGDE